MIKELIAFYQNGNYVVRLYNDGTKIKETEDDCFVAEFPDSIDLKITDYCDQNCPMCHEKSSTSGLHAELDAPFLRTLKRGTELAIGGGNPLSHPQLLSFLGKMKKQGVICNLTINEAHLEKSKGLACDLIKKKLIHGLGISIIAYNENVVEFARSYPNTVLHIINGIFTDFDKIANQDLKILILGYKKFGRGSAYFNSEIENNMDATKILLPELFDKFKCISFDNLALEQLKLSELISKQDYENMYMGADGEGSMYIDLVRGEVAQSSTNTIRYPIQGDIVSMFNKIQLKKV